MASRKRIAVWRFDDHEVRKLAQTGSFSLLISDILKKFKLSCEAEEVSVYRLDGAEIEEDDFDDVIDDVDVIIAKWPGCEKTSAHCAQEPVSDHLQVSPVLQSQAGPSSFPSYYTLPPFPPWVVKALDEKKPEVKMNERLTNTIVTCLKEDLMKYMGSTAFVLSKHYTAVCDALIKVYPFLADNSASCSGISLWKNKLVRKFKTHRKGASEVTAELQASRAKFGNGHGVKRVRPTIELNTSPKKCHPYLEVGEITRRQEVQDSGTIDTVVKAMEEECGQPIPDENLLAIMLKSTRGERKRRVAIWTTDLVAEHQFWMVYKYTNIVYKESLEIMASPIQSDHFEATLEILFEKLGECLPFKLANSKAFREIADKFGPDKKQIGYAALPLCFREKPTHLVCTGDDFEEGLDHVSRQIVVRINADYSFSVLLNHTELYSNIERLECAAALQLCTHYLLDVAYPCPKTYGMMEYVIGMSVTNKPVLTLASKLNIMPYVC